MDGYSIEEAAAVLGIPEGRVWELIARGVLSGTPQAGGAMRVYLRASSRAEAGSAVAHDTPAAAQSSRPASHGNGNGNGGSSTFELGPFRELLTEFRNLTERYGQALLALGEARGEVAALRQRVELLEARVDLRLPAAAAASTRAAPWASSPVEHWPEPAAGAAGPDEAEAPAPEPAAEAPPPAAPPQEERGGDVAAAAERGAVDEVRQAPAEPEPEPEPPANGGSRRHRRRQRQARAAIEGFAQALARADDPAGVELPGSEDAAAAFEALNREIAAASSPAPATPADHAELGEDAVAAAEVIEQVEMESPAPDASAEAGLEARAADTAELEAAGPPSERETVEEAGVSSERETVEEAAPADAPEPALTAELPSDAATPPAAVEPPGREEPPGLDETPPVGEAAGTVESLSSSAIYSAGWEEPDWIAEEDLGDIDLTEDEGGSAAPELEATLEPAPAPLDDVAVAGLTDDAGLLDRAPVAYQDLVDAPDGEAPEEDAPEGGPLDEATWVASPGTGDAAIGAQVAEPAPPAGTADAELAETDVADVSGPSAQPEPEARVEPIAEGAEVAEEPEARVEPIAEGAEVAEAGPEPEPEPEPEARIEPEPEEGPWNPSGWSPDVMPETSPDRPAALELSADWPVERHDVAEPPADVGGLAGPGQVFEPAAPAEDEGVAEATSQLHEEADASPDAVPVEADVHHDAEAPVEAGAVDEERQVVEMAQPSLGAEPVPGTEEPSPGSAVTEASPDVAGVGPVESVAVHPDEEELLRFDDEPHAPAWEPSEPPESKPEPVLDEPVPGAGEMEVAVGSALTAGTAATSREVETEATRPDEWPIADLPAAADSAHGARAVEEQPSEEDAALPEAATADAATPEAATPDAPTPVAPTPEDTGDAIPGGRDLDEALAALASLRFGPQARQELRGPAASGSEGRAEPRQGVERDVTAPSESAPAPDAESVGPPEAETWTPDPDWLRGRRGPAASAYRRLRRLFPG